MGNKGDGKEREKVFWGFLDVASLHALHFIHKTALRVF